MQHQSINLVTTSVEDRGRHPILSTSTQGKIRELPEFVLSPTGRASLQGTSTQRSSTKPNSQNMRNNTNSTTQRSSLVDQKFSTLDPHPLTGGPSSTILAENNIIDLEAHDLSNGQVRAIHGQIKRDCSLLRNRVRML